MICAAGVHNRWAAGTEVRPTDADFVEALHLIRELQAIGGIGMRVEEDKDRGPLAAIRIRRDDLPAENLETKLALPAFEGTTDRAVGRVRSGPDRPMHAYTAVRYRDYWFWVDDGDWQAERALGAVIFFFTLMEGAGNERLPLVTIPAQ